MKAGGRRGWRAGGTGKVWEEMQFQLLCAEPEPEGKGRQCGVKDDSQAQILKILVDG